jgi:Family of unknown function (DUF6117)
MSIPEYVRVTFNTLLRAAACGDLALVECADAITGELRYVICAIARDGADYAITPFGHLAPNNSYDGLRAAANLSGPRRACGGPRVRAGPGRV